MSNPSSPPLHQPGPPPAPPQQHGTASGQRLGYDDPTLGWVVVAIVMALVLLLLVVLRVA